MRKFLLLGLFITIAYVAHLYFTTGELHPFITRGEMSKEGRALQDVKERFLELEEIYNTPVDPEEIAFSFDPPKGPAWYVSEIEKLEKDLARIIPEVKVEYDKARAGWLRMKFRRFKKRIQVEELSSS